MQPQPAFVAEGEDTAHIALILVSIVCGENWTPTAPQNVHVWSLIKELFRL